MQIGRSTLTTPCATKTGRDVPRLIIADKYNRFPEDPACMAPYKHQELNMFVE